MANCNVVGSLIPLVLSVGLLTSGDSISPVSKSHYISPNLQTLHLKHDETSHLNKITAVASHNNPVPTSTIAVLNPKLYPLLIKAFQIIIFVLYEYYEST